MYSYVFKVPNIRKQEQTLAVYYTKTERQPDLYTKRIQVGNTSGFVIYNFPSVTTFSMYEYQLKFEEEEIFIMKTNLKQNLINQISQNHKNLVQSFFTGVEVKMLKTYGPEQV